MLNNNRFYLDSLEKDRFLYILYTVKTKSQINKKLLYEEDDHYNEKKHEYSDTYVRSDYEY